MKRIILQWLTCYAMAVGFVLVPALADTPHISPMGAAATVNGQVITIAQVSALAERLAGAEIVNQLVGNMLIDQQAKKQHILVTDADIDANIQHVSDQIKPQTLDDFLKQRQTTLPLYRNYVRVQVETEKLVQNKIAPIKMVHVRDILINVRPGEVAPGPGDKQHTQAEAAAIIAKIQAKLKAGESFASLAKQYSEDVRNSPGGGDIGIITNVTDTSDNPAARVFCADPAYLQAVFSLKPGEITAKPVQTANGLHLIQAVSTGSHPLPSDSSLYTAAYEASMDSELNAAVPSYVQSLGNSGNVKIYDGSDNTAPPGVAAIVNGETISTSEVSDLALKLFGDAAVNRLIVNTLVDQQAEAQNIAVTQSEIDANIDKLREKAKPQTLEQALMQSHMTLADLQDEQRLEIETGKLIAKGISPFKTVHICHIALLVKQPGQPALHHAKQYTEQDANALMLSILSKLKSGMSFGALAAQYSEDPTTKDKGGDLGIVTGKDPYDASFINAALALQPGEITQEPVKTAYGLELIEAISTGDSHPQSENQAYADAQNQAMDREIHAEFPSYIPNLIAHNKVVNYLSPQN